MEPFKRNEERRLKKSFWKDLGVKRRKNVHIIPL